MRPSLTRRLLTLYVATILVVVGIASALVWVMMRRALHAGLDETLRSEALAQASRLEADHGRVEFEAGTDPSHLPDPGDGLVQIVDERGEIVFSSAALTNNRTLIDRALPAVRTEEMFWFTAPLVPGDKSWRVVALHTVARPDEAPTVRDSEAGSVGVWVFVARSLAPVEQTLGQLASILALSVGAASLVALVGGWVAARRGTQPVRALAASVGRVNPGDPELSLNHAQVPVELEPIVNTTERLLERVRGELLRQRQLTADVAHDLRTPVAGVRTLLDVCLQRQRDSTEYVAVIEKARDAMRQLSRLLDDVLELSRLDAGVDQPAWSEERLEDVLAQALATVQPLATVRDVTIQIIPLPRIKLRTDRGKFMKIVSNLLSNAVEHSPPGEVVQITAQIDEGSLELAVTDRGPGVPPEFRDRIFDRFVRGDAARAGADGHQGLGLPIAAGLARVLGGEVKLCERSEPGSRFIVRLPLESC